LLSIGNYSIRLPTVDYEFGSAGAVRVEAYLQMLARHLPRTELRASFAIYFFGLLSDAERKSVEPLAARGQTCPQEVERAHGRLLHFISDGKWSDADVRASAAHYAMSAMAVRAPIKHLIVDDTGFLKQGMHSPGVQRQYTGSAGKIANCQTAVSLSVASDIQHLPIDFALYLPQTWCSDPIRMKAARVPDDVTFQTKTELAIAMIQRAKRAGVAGDIVLADAAYGSAAKFRNALMLEDLHYAVGVSCGLKVCVAGPSKFPMGTELTIQELADGVGRAAYRKYTWRQGSNTSLSSVFCMVRVIARGSDGSDERDTRPVWLIMEWPDGEPKPSKFSLTTLPHRQSWKQIIRTLKERWRTEKAYEEMKGELGLDHFEGRTFTGWHHHVSVALSCYAFVVAERMRHFSPSAEHAATDHALAEPA
jgi:SRSO17 transposase